MNCALTQNQLDSLLRKVDGDLRTMMKNQIPFDLSNYVRSIYDLVLNETKDPGLALSYAQLVPGNIFRITPFNPEMKKFLRETVSLDDLDDLNENFKNIDNVSKFLGIGKEIITDLENTISDENTDSIQPNTEVETPQQIAQSIPALSEPFKAKVNSAMSTTGQETKGIHSNVPDPNQAMYYVALRSVLSAVRTASTDNSADIQTSQFKNGVVLTAVASKTLKFEDLKIDTQEHIKNKNQAVIDAHETGVVLLLTDKYGYIYNFDDKGNPVPEGKPAYYSLRKVLFDGTTYRLSSYDTQNEQELAKNNNISLEEAKAIKQRELKQIYDIRQYISQNPENRLNLNITGGSFGFLSNDYKVGGVYKSTPLSKINFADKATTLYIAPIDTDTGERQGRTYLKVEGIDQSIAIDRPKVDTTLANNLASLLVDDLKSVDKISGEKRALTGLEKLKIFQDYAETKSTGIFLPLVNNGESINIKLQGELLDVSTPEKKQEAKEKLSNYLVTTFININRNALATSYTDFQIEGDTIQTQSKNYKDYLFTKLGGYVQVNENNQVVQLNGYLNFELPTVEKEILYPKKEEETPKEKPESKLVQENPTDKPVEGQSARDRFKGLQKSKNITNEATEKQIAEAKKWYESSPLAKHLPYKAAFNIVNSDAFAQWTVNGITLFKGGNYSDLYHEAWHGFSQMFLTREQKKNLYNEMRKLKGSFTSVGGAKVPYSLASDLQIEEFMAEDFRKYILSDGKTILDGRPSRNTIFRKIWNLLKALFTGATLTEVVQENKSIATIKELYDKLHIGNINEYTPSLNNIQFGILNKGIERAVRHEPIESLGYDDSQLITTTIDSLFSKLIDISNLETKSNRFTSMLFRNSEGLKLAYDFALNDPEFGLVAIKNNLQQELEATEDDLTKQRLEAKIDTLTYAIRNFGDIDQSIAGLQDKGVVAYHRLKSKYLDFNIKVIDLQEQQETEAASIEKGIRMNDRAGNEMSIKELASNETLYLIKSLYKVKNGKVVNNSLGVPELVDFDQVWNRLIKTLSNTTDMQSMYQKLEQEAEIFPVFNQLLDKLGKPENFRDDASFTMWTKFRQDFGKTHIPLIQMVVNKTTIDDEGNPIDPGKELYSITVGNVQTNWRQVPRKFYQQFATSPKSRYISRDAEGAFLDVNNILEDFKNIGSPENKLKFLNAIGIFLSDTTQIKDALAKNAANVFFLRSTLETLNNNGVKIRDPYKQLAQAYPELNLKGEQGNLNRLYDLQARYSDEFSNFSVTNAENNIQYEHSLNNSLTQIINRINDAKTYQELIQVPSMSYLNIDKNPQAASSIWLASIFNLDKKSPDFGKKIKQNKIDDVTLKIDNLSGVQTILNGETFIDGVATSRSDEYTKPILDLHFMLLRGTPELPRHASKSSAYGVYVTNVRSEDSKTKYLYVDTSKFLSQFGNRGYELARDIIFRYLDAELKRVNIVKTGTYNNVPGFSERGKEFTIFDTILSQPTKNKLYGYQSFSEVLESNSEAAISLKKIVNEEVKSYFDALTAQTKEKIEEAELIDQQIYDSIRSEIGGRESVRIKEEDLKNAAIQSYTYNQWIHNMETLNILYGDPAAYDFIKEEFHKRNASIASTGYTAATDAESMKYLNEYIGRPYAKLRGSQVKQFSPVADSAVMQDAKVASAYINDYKNAFEKFYKNLGLKGEELETAIKNSIAPYESMTEGDAQGWVTFDFYRGIRKLMGKWGPYEDLLFNKIVKGEYVSARDVSRFFPVMKYQYFGPLANMDLYLPGLHKFSLMPLIPTVIAGTNLENLHNKMVDQGIDYSLYQSGSKVATVTTNGKIDKIYKDLKTRELEDIQFTKNPIYLDYLKDQLDIDSKFKGKVVFSTQLRSIILSGLYKNGIPSDYKPEAAYDTRSQSWNKLSDEEKVSSSKFYALAKEYKLNILKLNEIKKQELIREAGWDIDEKGNPIPADMTKLLAIVQKELIRQDLADHEWAFVEATSAGNIKHDLSISLSVDKIERVLTAVVNRRLINQKVNGEGLIQVSGSLFENTAAIGQKFTKPTAEQLDQYGTDDLPTYRQGENGVTKAMKVKVALQGQFTALLGLTHKDGDRIYSRDRLNEMLKDEQWLNQDDNRRMVTMVGVRIPVQGLNSMEFMEVYEFLPEEAGSIIVPPSEIVAKSGSDFDIDKLTIMMPNIKRARNGKSKLFTQISREEAMEAYREIKRQKLDKALRRTSEGEILPLDALAEEEIAAIDKLLSGIFGDQFGQDLSEQEINDILSEEGLEDFETFYFKLNGSKAIENDIIWNIRSILQLPENFVPLIRPNDVDLAKGVADEMEDLNDRMGAREYSPRYDVKKVDGKKVKTTRKVGEKEKTYTSPTRIMEPVYNWYKHVQNNSGKNTLGIAAVDNKFNVHFNEIGALLNPFYGVDIKAYEAISKKDPKKLTDEEKVMLSKYRRIKLFLPHNSVQSGGYELISVSDIYNKDNVAITDIISQLMNGLVDVEKDPWVYWVQGNTEIAPTLLFLIQSGVPLREAVYFVSQPLVKEYVKQQRLAKSKFAGPLGTAPRDNPKFFASKARQEVLMNPKFGFGMKSASETFGKKLYDATVKATDKVGEDAFKLDSLKKTISEDNSETARALFLHFLELETIAKSGPNRMKFDLDMDRKKSPTLFQARTKILKVETLKGQQVMYENPVQKMLDDTIIGSFYHQDFQLKIWKHIMPLRTNEVVGNFLLNKMQSKDFIDHVDFTFRDPEKFTNEFMNDFISFIFQNSLKQFSLDNLTNYKSLTTSERLPAVPVLLKHGAFVKDNVLYFDKAQLQRDWETKAFKSDTYKEAGLALVPEKAFITKTTSSKDEFFKFVIEREYLRSTYPMSQFKFESGIEDGNYLKTSYEEKLRDMALENIWNNWSLFYGPNSFANQFTALIKAHPNLIEDYSFIRNLSVSPGKNGIRNLKVNDRILDSDKLNTYHENLRQLSNPMIIKSSDPVENEKISNFFSKMPIYSFLQSGLGKSEMSLVRIMPTETTTRLIEGPSKEYIKNLDNKEWSDKTLNAYYNRFVLENSDKKQRSRLKDYVVPENQTEEVIPEMSTDIKLTSRENLFSYSQIKNDVKRTGSEMKKMAQDNPEVIFIFNENKNKLSGETYDAILRPMDNSFGLTVRAKASDLPASLWTDDTFDNNIASIEQDIEQMKDMLKAGNALAFNEDGYARYMIKAAPKTFIYLSRRLFEEFGYINPGSEKSKSLRAIIQSTQPITDEEVEELINNCL